MKKILSLIIILTIIVIMPIQAYDFTSGEYTINRNEAGYVGNSLLMSNFSWGMLACTGIFVPLIFLVDDTAFGILTMMSFTAWTLFQGFAAISLRDMINMSERSGSNFPRPNFALWSHIISASFGMGGIVGGGLIFSDDTAAAIIMTSLCCAVSMLSGIIANFGNYAYANRLTQIFAYNVNNNAFKYANLYEPYKLNYGSDCKVNIPIMSITF